MEFKVGDVFEYRINKKNWIKVRVEDIVVYSKVTAYGVAIINYNEVPSSWPFNRTTIFSIFSDQMHSRVKMEPNDIMKDLL